MPRLSRTPRTGERVVRVNTAPRANAFPSSTKVTLQSISKVAWLDTTVPSSIISDGARQFILASTRYFSRADDTNFSTGDIDFWMAGWAYFDTVATNISLFGKWDSPSNQREYLIFFEPGGGNTINFGVSNDGGTANFVSSGVTPSTATWYFILAWHDSVNNTINIKINNGTTVSEAHTTGVFNGTASTAFGAHDIVSAATYFHDGRLDSWAFGKSPSGGVAGIISAINTSLYDGGTGKTYADLTSAEKTDWGLVEFYNFAENAGTNATGAHAGLTMTASASAPTAAVGIAAGQASSGDVVSSWQDQSGNGNHVVQATVGARPLLSGGAVLLDGSNDWLLKTSATATAVPYTIYTVLKQVTWTSGDFFYSHVASSATRGSLRQVVATPQIEQAGSAAGDNNSDLVVDTYAVVSAIFNGASSSLQVNNSTAVVSDTGTGDVSAIAIGARGDGASFGNVAIKEYILCSGAHSDALKNQVIALLQAKHGV